MTPKVDEILAELKNGDGSLWEMALGELHSTYNEAPFWILVEEVNDARKAAVAFSKIIRRHIDANPDIQFTLSIYCIKANRKIFVDYLEGREFFDEQKIETVGDYFDDADLTEDDLFLNERKRRMSTQS